MSTRRDGRPEATETQTVDQIPKGLRETLSHDVFTQELLIQIFTVLKKIEYHLSLATDTNLEDQDVQ